MEFVARIHTAAAQAKYTAMEGLGDTGWYQNCVDTHVAIACARSVCSLGSYFGEQVGYSVEPDAQAAQAVASASHLCTCAFAGFYFWQKCCEQVKCAGEGAKTLRRYLQECLWKSSHVPAHVHKQTPQVDKVCW